MSRLKRSGTRGRLIQLAAAWIVVLIHSAARGQTSTTPEEGIQSRPSTSVLLQAGHVVISPDRQLERGDVLLREGKIVEVSAQINPPVDAEVIDCRGKYLYAAFIDPLVEVSVPNVTRADDHWNGFITPQRQTVSALPNDDKLAAQYRKAGFGAILLAPNDNIMKGTSALMSTARLPGSRTLLKSHVFQHITLVKQRSERSGYPTSPMGVVALTRQTLSDAQWYQQAQQAYRADSGLPAPDANAALEALAPLVLGQQTALFDSGNELYALRADRMAREFNLRAIIRGSGREYRQLSAIVETGRTFILPVDFPKPPEVGSLEAATAVSLQALMHWHLAPENPARMDQANVPFVLTANGLTSTSEFLDAVRKAVARGLKPQTALAALTTRTAQLLSVDHLIGSLERGKLANILIASGELWDKKSVIEETWVQGQRHRWQERSHLDASGKWELKLGHSEADSQLPGALELKLESMTEKPKGVIALPGQLTTPKPPATQNSEKSEPDQGTPQPDQASKKNTDSQAQPPEAQPPEAQPPEAQDVGKPKELPGAEKPLELKKPDSLVPPPETSSPTDQKTPDAASASTPDSKAESKTEAKAESKPATKLESRAAELKQLSVNDYRIEAAFPCKPLLDSPSGQARLSLTLLKSPSAPNALVGRILWPDGTVSQVTGVPAAGSDVTQAETSSNKSAAQSSHQPPAETRLKSTEAVAELVCEVNYPLGAFGLKSSPEQPEWLLIKNATVWTADQAGTLTDSDVLVHRGVIDQVGQDLTAPEGAVVIDAQGKHVSPGIIDCHSHMATDGGVNESGQAVTAEVRVGDFIDSNDVTIYYQLAGGVTTANILHGSANPIGGQNQVIKLRWGASDEALKMREAPLGIKFALGENVKQSNWGERATGRYPQTRMGVEQIFRDRFEAARLYKAARAAAGTERALPVRRDYELDALVEILDKQRWIHCHSYRQDEVVAFLGVLDDYGITVGSLQHILEGYKVADVMARHGATGSTFSDWWAYKFEVLDAIPYNGALMHRAGIVVSFNSDDDELARHLNHEAAKAVKYGGLSPEEALQFVTLNPAKQLRIDQYVGSIKPGKQADLVIWSGSPLSTFSRCEQTWIDGRRYFDRQSDAQMRSDADDLRRKLIARVLDSGERGSGDGRDPRDPSLWFVRYDEFCNHADHHHDEHDHEHE